MPPTTTTATATTTTTIRDHYEVLGIGRDADATVVKKAHRKLALKLHPDKNPSAADEFRRVQAAYECLSDKAERKWYDEHREAILRGWTSESGGMDVDILLDIVPYMHAGCFSGYGDEEGAFFAVYADVFHQIYQGEQDGWVSEGNIDEMPLADMLSTATFGNGSSDWSSVVSKFYTSWESFSSCLAFAWVDKYDSARDAENRRIRRLMEDDNKKLRKLAKRKRNEAVAALVRFCKRRDPRIQAQRAKVEEEKAAKAEEARKASKIKKEKTQVAKEEWRKQAALDMARAEEEDAAAGRIRLADLEDDYDYGGGKRGRGGKKKGKKNRNVYDDDDEEEEVDSMQVDQDGEEQVTETEGAPAGDDEKAEATGNGDEEATDASPLMAEDEDPSSPLEDAQAQIDYYDDEYDGTSESEESEEPEIYRCECCRKDFKSVGQMDNHAKSKKHKEALKKWQAKQKKKDEEMDDLLDELALEP